MLREHLIYEANLQSIRLRQTNEDTRSNVVQMLHSSDTSFTNGCQPKVVVSTGLALTDTMSAEGWVCR